jgi:YD repeat-containing protein
MTANTASPRRVGTINIGPHQFNVYQGAVFNIDVPSSDPFFTVIGKLSARGITAGTSPTEYSPGHNVTHQQMAVFIIKGLGEFNPPTPGSQRFVDVPPSSPFYNYIEQMGARNIRPNGCGGNNYCPTSPVTRSDMAYIIVRALGILDPPTPASQRFNDVATNHANYKYIDQMAMLGITAGTGNNNYSPTDPVTRAQMAAFITKAFDAPVDYAAARVNPYNRTGQAGEDLLSGNFNWSLPLVSLPGRAGLDLGLSLTYNSLVWTPSVNNIKFDADNGYPGPGFRLGFPVIQRKYFNPQIGTSGVIAFLLITPSGRRVELRQVPSTNRYESADSSYMEFIEADPAILLTPDGSSMEYGLYGSEYRCKKITDRNGNYISATYHSDGRLDKIIDTLNREVSFGYNSNSALIEITQLWGSATHKWAEFTYSPSVPVGVNFSGRFVDPSPNFSINALTRVTLASGLYFTFEYNNYGQVKRINEKASDTTDHLLNYVSYNLPTTTTTPQWACPSFTQRQDGAENWNGGAAATTSFEIDSGRRSGSVTTPDQTTYKEFFHAALDYKRGLLSESQIIISGGVVKKTTAIDWTQDDENFTYRQNPRPEETKVYDGIPATSTNRRKTTITYTDPTLFGGIALPIEVKEYNTDDTVIRRTVTAYNVGSPYVVSGVRRIIGLVTSQSLYNSGTGLYSKMEYQYDVSANLETQSGATHHDDVNYGIGYLSRGNLCRVRRFDVTNSTSVESTIGYKTTGTVAYSRDPLSHQTTISYTDSYSDGVNRNTFAYPKTVTDGDGHASTMIYDYDKGVVTSRTDPKGAQLTTSYDFAGRVLQVTNVFNDAYTRYEYPTSHTAVNTFTTIESGTEAFSTQILDGAGRVILTVSDFPGSTGLS